MPMANVFTPQRVILLVMSPKIDIQITKYGPNDPCLMHLIEVVLHKKRKEKNHASVVTLPPADDPVCWGCVFFLNSSICFCCCSFIFCNCMTSSNLFTASVLEAS